MKLKATSKSNYYLNRHDMKVMSVALRCGYRVFPSFMPTQAWVRYNPLITLSGTFRGRLYELIDKPFDQAYLTYYTMVFYHKFYDKHILNKIEVEIQEIKAPPPPEEPKVMPKSIFAPSPPMMD